ncbi:soluble lytic transglycosylase B [Litchfieldella qijiaojingensis]|uniref:Soluble lytic transglycosylase B n=1 Tax=Litchfieldella qijiaojingensis TaxID=980347 RepID=A0ABQ2YP83_9GAMM|nr:lytic murein transglycosylase B [Halomonas qijiaojingensis]GGX90671.1 soluble lytic transglycosylase B [Halomonas qijiaojingensis]
MKASRPHGRAAWWFAAGLWLSLLPLASQAAMNFDPGQHDDVAALIDELEAKGIERSWLVDVMQGAEYQQGVLDAMAGAAERRLRWDEYREIFLQPERIERGVDFIEAHREAFARVEAEYGVPPEVVAAIIGVETSYGRHTGRHRVIDSLSTLAFHHPSRGRFFRGELLAFLEITREQEVDPGSLKGSYAGAMGYPQFIPTSYRAYAVDFDGDSKRDLWDNPVDAIGSVGNYFARHGWRADAPIYSEALGPDELPREVAFNQTQPPYETLEALAEHGIRPAREGEFDGDRRVIPLALDHADKTYSYRLGHDNFYVITRYNHSHLYAMAVTELAEAILAKWEGGA